LIDRLQTHVHIIIMTQRQLRSVATTLHDDRDHVPSSTPVWYSVVIHCQYAWAAQKCTEHSPDSQYINAHHHNSSGHPCTLWRTRHYSGESRILQGRCPIHLTGAPEVERREGAGSENFFCIFYIKMASFYAFPVIFWRCNCKEGTPIKRAGVWTPWTPALDPPLHYRTLKKTFKKFLCFQLQYGEKVGTEKYFVLHFYLMTLTH